MTQLEPETFEIDPKRLQWSTYNHETEREEGGGDIRASYSADVIAMSGKVRRPFRWRGELMVCVGTQGRGGVEQASAYHLVSVKLFDGTPVTYNGKTGTADGAESARNDPRGFYDGMSVVSGKDRYVLTGPPVKFVAGDEPERPANTPSSQQLDLFA